MPKTCSFFSFIKKLCSLFIFFSWRYLIFIGRSEKRILVLEKCRMQAEEQAFLTTELLQNFYVIIVQKLNSYILAELKRKHSRSFRVRVRRSDIPLVFLQHTTKYLSLFHILPILHYLSAPIASCTKITSSATTHWEARTFRYPTFEKAKSCCNSIKELLFLHYIRINWILCTSESVIHHRARGTQSIKSVIRKRRRYNNG